MSHGEQLSRRCCHFLDNYNHRNAQHSNFLIIDNGSHTLKAYYRGLCIAIPNAVCRFSSSSSSSISASNVTASLSTSSGGSELVGADILMKCDKSDYSWLYTQHETLTRIAQIREATAAKDLKTQKHAGSKKGAPADELFVAEHRRVHEVRRQIMAHEFLGRQTSHAGSRQSEGRRGWDTAEYDGHGIGSDDTSSSSLSSGWRATLDVKGLRLRRPLGVGGLLQDAPMQSIVWSRVLSLLNITDESSVHVIVTSPFGSASYLSLRDPPQSECGGETKGNKLPEDVLLSDQYTHTSVIAEQWYHLVMEQFHFKGISFISPSFLHLLLHNAENLFHIRRIRHRVAIAIEKVQRMNAAGKNQNTVTSKTKGLNVASVSSSRSLPSHLGLPHSHHALTLPSESYHALHRQLHTAPLSALPFTGVVLDVGHSCCTAVPYVMGRCVYDAIYRLPVGGSTLTQLLKSTLSLTQLDLKEDDMLVESIKETCCGNVVFAAGFGMQSMSESYQTPREAFRRHPLLDSRGKLTPSSNHSFGSVHSSSRQIPDHDLLDNRYYLLPTSAGLGDSVIVLRAPPEARVDERQLCDEATSGRGGRKRERDVHEEEDQKEKEAVDREFLQGKRKGREAFLAKLDVELAKEEIDEHIPTDEEGKGSGRSTAVMQEQDASCQNHRVLLDDEVLCDANGINYEEYKLRRAIVGPSFTAFAPASVVSFPDHPRMQQQPLRKVKASPAHAVSDSSHKANNCVIITEKGLFALLRHQARRNAGLVSSSGNSHAKSSAKHHGASTEETAQHSYRARGGLVGASVVDECDETAMVKLKERTIVTIRHEALLLGEALFRPAVLGSLLTVTGGSSLADGDGSVSSSNAAVALAMLTAPHNRITFDSERFSDHGCATFSPWAPPLSTFLESVNSNEIMSHHLQRVRNAKEAASRGQSVTKQKQVMASRKGKKDADFVRERHSSFHLLPQLLLLYFHYSRRSHVLCATNNQTALHIVKLAQYLHNNYHQPTSWCPPARLLAPVMMQIMRELNILDDSHQHFHDAHSPNQHPEQIECDDILHRVMWGLVMLTRFGDDLGGNTFHDGSLTQRNDDHGASSDDSGDEKRGKMSKVSIKSAALVRTLCSEASGSLLPELSSSSSHDSKDVPSSVSSLHLNISAIRNRVADMLSADHGDAKLSIKNLHGSSRRGGAMVPLKDRGLLHMPVGGLTELVTMSINTALPPPLRGALMPVRDCDYPYGSAQPHLTAPAPVIVVGGGARFHGLRERLERELSGGDLCSGSDGTESRTCSTVLHPQEWCRRLLVNSNNQKDSGKQVCNTENFDDKSCAENLFVDDCDDECLLDIPGKGAYSDLFDFFVSSSLAFSALPSAVNPSKNRNTLLTSSVDIFTGMVEFLFSPANDSCSSSHSIGSNSIISKDNGVTSSIYDDTQSALPKNRASQSSPKEIPKSPSKLRHHHKKSVVEVEEEQKEDPCLAALMLMYRDAEEKEQQYYASLEKLQPMVAAQAVTPASIDSTSATKIVSEKRRNIFIPILWNRLTTLP